MGRINSFLWYFFFSAYWTAHELGEKRNPESNASYLLALNIGWNLFGMCQIGLYSGYKISNVLLIIFCLVPAIFIPYYMTKSKSRFQKKSAEFAYLRDQKLKRRRYILLIMLTLWSIGFVAGIAVLRNISRT